MEKTKNSICTLSGLELEGFIKFRAFWIFNPLFGCGESFGKGKQNGIENHRLVVVDRMQEMLISQIS